MMPLDIHIVPSTDLLILWQSDLDYSIYIHIGYPILYMLHIKFGFDWPSCLRGEDV